MSKKLIVFLVVIIAGLSLALLVQPQSANAAACQPGGDVLGLPTWYEYLPGETEAGGRCRPVIENSRAALPIGIAILEIMLRLVGLAAVAYIIWGSIKMIITQGEPDKIKEAKGIIKNAVIGLIIAIAATGIVSFIGNNIRAT